MSYFDDAKIPVCRFLETSYIMKFFQNCLLSFSSVSQVKHVAGSPLVDFSAESLATSNKLSAWSTVQQ